MTAPLALAAPPDDACLDFVNTRYWRGSERPSETLATPEDLLAWITPRAPAALATAVHAAWRAEPQGETAAHARLIALRETLFRLLAAAATARPPAAADLAALNAILAQAPARQFLMPEGDAYALAAPASPEAILFAPVLWSAADLLAGRRRAHLRQCANPHCGWLFLDDSKSGNRRWCAMSACGNRAKARRHYLRHRAEPVDPAAPTR